MLKRNPEVIDKRIAVNWIILIYFFSGTCSLIDEVIWVRLLKLTLGNTVYASSVVVYSATCLNPACGLGLLVICKGSGAS